MTSILVKPDVKYNGTEDITILYITARNSYNFTLVCNFMIDGCSYKSAYLLTQILHHVSHIKRIYPGSTQRCIYLFIGRFLSLKEMFLFYLFRIILLAAFKRSPIVLEACLSPQGSHTSHHRNSLILDLQLCPMDREIS